MIAKTSEPSFVQIETNPVPKGARAGHLTSADGVRLRYGIFPRQGDRNRGTVVLLQGRAEFIEKYFETIVDFQKRGFTVAAFDLRGQGGSDRLIANTTLGYVEHFDDYWTDLQEFHHRVVLPDCPPPHHLVGHSTGGLIGLLAATRDRLMFDRVFLSSPLVGLPGLPFSLKWSARVINTARFFGLSQVPLGRREDKEPDEFAFERNPLTSDRNRFLRAAAILKVNPALGIGFPTIGWVGSTLNAMQVVNSDTFASQLKIPVFICAAARDIVVDTGATEMLGLRLKAGHHVVIPGAKHELFMETDAVRAQLFAAFDAFVTEQS